MRIYIPTRGRPHKQIFYNALPQNLKECCVFVVNSVDDMPGVKAKYLTVPPNIKNIGEKRHWIIGHHEIETHGPEVIMADDDLRLNARRQDDPTKFRPMLPADYVHVFMRMYQNLDDYAHVTVMPREGGNRQTENQECTRAMRLIGYNAAIFKKERVDFARCPVKEDFDVTLQLLSKGYKNLMLAAWVQDDGGGSNAKGGCSMYRDEKMMVESANRLRTLHPQFVKVVQKKTKGAWGGGTRTDVVVSWKQAYRSSQK